MAGVIRMDSNLCVGCGLCAKDCPHKAIEVTDRKAHFIADGCMECGHCVAVCPRAAVSMDGYDMSESKEYDLETFYLDSEQFLNAVRFRRSIRQYKEQDVEREKLEKILAAGRYTPTGSNRQNIRYIVMRHPEDKIEKDGIEVFQKLIKPEKAIQKVIRLPFDPDKFNPEAGFFFHHAPAVIFVISENPVNASLASANMETMAESMGLGVLYVGLFVRTSKISRNIQKKLGLKGKEKLVTAMAVGCPVVKYARTVPRRPAQVEWK